ncbi:hypothetical protein CFIMG_008216RA00001 [Ceratocystis fimbriata CBS 114723]|uniref:Uncharacterized protein n=1 Tax=Ceratocystis fimbriata CBS 114723 TaxID=1035309 RepID=A0A2C5X5T1_9PEZI|nr:hypothetical protein CFIMG_008216RA00001 [Ceratocystis fimbriata CBS 114723]
MEDSGVRQLDFAPQNVLLVGPEVVEAARMPRVIPVDFNVSTVFGQLIRNKTHHKNRLPNSSQYLVLLTTHFLGLAEVSLGAHSRVWWAAGVSEHKIRTTNDLAQFAPPNHDGKRSSDFMKSFRNTI